MSRKRYRQEFKREAANQISEGGYSVADVAHRLGTTTHSLYAWRQKYETVSEKSIQGTTQQSEINAL